LLGAFVRVDLHTVLFWLDSLEEKHASVKLLADASVALGTMLLAFFTYGLARRTRDLAKEGNDAAALADQHHQESFAPIIVLESASAHRSSNTVTELPSNQSKTSLHYVFSGRFRNVGGGAALNIEFQPTFEAVVDGTRQPVQPLAAGAHVDVEIGFEVEKWAVERPMGAGIPFSVSVSYWNTFGSEGKTVASRDPQNNTPLSNEIMPPASLDRLRRNEPLPAARPLKFPK
jgi:hypothetical protein